MGKVKIKRKSTLIDMTAMSDVTVLLLTFFMLTSTFLQKEPAMVMTPSSVSEDDIPLKNYVTVLVSPADYSGKVDPTFTEGKIFIKFAGDTIINDEDPLRRLVFRKAISLYNAQQKQLGLEGIKLNAEDTTAFVKANMLGTAFKYLPEVLSMEPAKREELMSDLTNQDQEVSKKIGIPISVRLDKKTNKPMILPDGNECLSDFQIWMKALSLVANEDRQKYLENHSELIGDDAAIRAVDMLYNALMQGECIVIKADRDTPFSVINLLFDQLRSVKLNKFRMMTAYSPRTTEQK